MKQTAWIVSLECEKCVRSSKKLILIPSGTKFKAGCKKCQRHLTVQAERFYVYAGFLIIKVREY